MKWTRVADLHQQLQRLWDSGKIANACVQAQVQAQGQTLLPLRLSLKTPSAAQLSADFAAVQDWIAELRSVSHWQVEMRSSRHRLFGQNDLPQAVCITQMSDLLALLKRTREGRQLQELAAYTAQHLPALLPWLQTHALQALAHAAHWPQLLALVRWLQQHPRPGIYLRQVDLPGMDSKFIEQHRTLLASLCDQVLPPEQIEETARGVEAFAARYGFLSKPERVRLRSLDPACPLVADWPVQDVSMDGRCLAALGARWKRVFITENEINYLAFPDVAQSLLIFGAGYGFSNLAKAAWLGQVELYYWGDIDTHGFAILHQLRATWPHAQSILMDLPTLLQHQANWGREDKPLRHSLPNLHAHEQEVYALLCADSLGEQVRLEQEHIGFGAVLRAVQGLE